MSKILQLKPDVPIPDYLTGEIQSKLAYVDEAILSAKVSETALSIEIDAPQVVNISVVPGGDRRKVQRVVSMAKGAFKPKMQG
jgi:hypothetical protein